MKPVNLMRRNEVENELDKFKIGYNSEQSLKELKETLNNALEGKFPEKVTTENTPSEAQNGPSEAPAATDGTNTPDSAPAPVEEATAPSGVLLRYEGVSASLRAFGYLFTQEDPFVLVSEEDADKFEDYPEILQASADQARAFYA